MEESVATKPEMSPIEMAIAEVNQAFGTTKLRREFLANKLMDLVQKLDINPNECSPKLLEAQIELFTKADSVLASQEKAALAQAKIQMAKKDTETHADLAKGVIAVLEKIKPADLDRLSTSSGVVDDEDAAKRAETLFEEEIDDSELALESVGDDEKEQKADLGL